MTFVYYRINFILQLRLFQALEASSAELKKSSEELETELRRVADKCAELCPRNSVSASLYIMNRPFPPTSAI